MIYSGGLKFLLLAALLYAPGTILFFIVRRQLGVATFASVREGAVFAATVVAAAAALYGLASGRLSI